MWHNVPSEACGFAANVQHSTRTKRKRTTACQLLCELAARWHISMSVRGTQLLYNKLQES